MTPLVSVIVPVYNGENTVKQTIDSVLGQTFGDFELVVVDDGSEDDTPDVLESVTDTRVRVVSIPHRGVGAARNAGAAVANGRLIAFLDADDLASPEWLDWMTKLLGDSTVAIACCGAHVRSEVGGSYVIPSEKNPLLATDTAALFLAGTFCVRRDIFLESGGYDEHLAYSENSELAIRMTSLCRSRGLAIASTSEALVLVEREKRGRRALRNIVRSTPRILREHWDLFQARPETLSNWLAAAGVAAAKIGRDSAARVFLWRSARSFPRSPTVWARLALVHMPWLRRRVWAKLDEREAA